MSLALKYRPKSFQELCGQETTKIILEARLNSMNIKQPLLFYGPAGCGKTTAARIYAKRINNGIEPFELDAARNSGVDSIREICNDAYYKPIAGDYKIYIIDECHAISTYGWQTFLKILEEPPESSIFIFCTTELNKIPETVLTRLEPHRFSKITKTQFSNRIKEIAELENLTGIDQDIINALYTNSNHCLRKALNMLDTALISNQPMSVELINSLTGSVDALQVVKIIKGLAEKDPQVMILLDKIINKGINPQEFITSLLGVCYDICLYWICRSTQDLDTAIHYGELEQIIKDETPIESYREVQTLLLNIYNNTRWNPDPIILIKSMLLNHLRIQ